MAALRPLITSTFQRIPNKGLGKQDFSVNHSTNKKVPLPYEGNLNDVLVFNAMKDSTDLCVFFTLQADV